MKITIEQFPKEPKYPYFVCKYRLSNAYDYGMGRIIWCPSPGVSFLFKKGNGDNKLKESIGEEINFDPTYYKVIDKLILETEYINQ